MKIQSIFNITILPILLTLSGCTALNADDSFLNKIGASQVEKESVDTIDSKIVKGKTTKSQIEQMFGKPHSRDKDSSGNESWTYMDMNTRTKLITYVPGLSFLGGTTMDSKFLTIYFNKNGTVRDYSFSESGY